MGESDKKYFLMGTTAKVFIHLGVLYIKTLEIHFSTRLAYEEKTLSKSYTNWQLAMNVNTH